MPHDCLTLDIKRLSGILKETKDKSECLHRVCNLASQHGLSKDDLARLFDLVLSPPKISSLTHDEKLLVIENALIPRGFLLPDSLILRIISQISVPCISHIKRKIRMTEPTVLIALLKFLVQSLNYFGKPGHTRLLRSLPILFRCMTVGYARPYIAKLIRVTFSMKADASLRSAGNEAAGTPKFFKGWYVRLTIDLYAKFPRDKSLLQLLLFINQYCPKANVEALMHTKGLCLPQTKNALLTNEADSWSVDDAGSTKQATVSKPGINDTFSPQPPEPVGSDLEGITILERLIPSIQNNRHVVDSFSLGGYAWPNLKEEYPTRVQSTANHNFIPQDRMVDHKETRLQMIHDYLLYELELGPSNELLDGQNSTASYNLMQRSKLLPLFPVERASAFCEQFLRPSFDIISVEPMLDNTTDLMIPNLALSVIKLLAKWKLSTEIDTLLFHKICSDALASWWEFLAHCGHKNVPLTCILLLRFLKSLPTSDTHRYSSDPAILMPLLLVTRLAFTGDPIVQSYICGHIAFGKKHHFKSAALKAIHNTYVADLVNLYWGDRGLQYSLEPESPHQAFLLHRELISLLTALPTFNSGSETLNTIGGVFMNLAWSAILAQLIMELEDQSNGIAVRHYGTVTRESVLRISDDLYNPWLDMSFETVKREVMKSLDRLGFTGLADLIFTSVRGLQDQRENPCIGSHLASSSTLNNTPGSTRLS